MERPAFGFLSTENLGLFTDRYELTMQQGYRAVEHTPEATFSLFFRSLPADWGYVIAAGLEQALAGLQAVSFGERALAHLAEEGFSESYLEYLGDFEFTGTVRAIPEGTPVFPNEPLLEVTAPIDQAQLFETLLINQVGFQSLIATKAARMREAVDRFGGGQTLVDFGSRRAHGTDAGIKAARSAYIGGVHGTSNEAAGELFDLPVFGTMAHSWIQSFPTERAAFEAFAETYGDDSVFLIDTYDTVEGAKTALSVAEQHDLEAAGVRLDSGDLAELSREVDALLPAEWDLFVSSGVDEYLIEDFFGDGGVADGFGPGTALTTSKDAPTLNAVYKLVAVEEDGALQPRMKLSTGKVTYPGAKRIHRIDRDGHARDILGLVNEALPGEDILVDAMVDGEIVYDLPDLETIRERARNEVDRLPSAVRDLDGPATYPVDIGDGLAATTERVQAELRAELGQ